MKKLLLLAAASLLTPVLYAQPWMEGREHQRVKLEQVVDQYNATRDANKWEDEEEEERERAEQGAVTEGPRKEGRNYHFDRWNWYWQQHTDEQGYLVSPLKNFEEWQRYRQESSRFKAFAKSTGTTANWVFEGPDSSKSGYNGIGRIQTVTFHPTDSNTFWAGTAGGGAWKTTNNGVSWTAMTDHLPVLGVADIAYNPKNPNTMYLCTGDKDAGDNYSIGVLKSYDGGATWDTTGLQWNVTQMITANAILVNPVDTNSLLLATSLGIYKSNNGGASWKFIRNGNFKQLAYKPNDTAVVYAAGRSINVFRSADGGANWTQVTNVNAARIALAVTPANPDIVKLVVSNTSYGLEGIYSSSDAGVTFTKIHSDSSCARNILNGSANLTTSSCGGQGWYDLAIAISPVDSNYVVVGGVNTWASVNGGKSFKIANQWIGGAPGVKVVHADKHFLGYQPLRPNTLFEGNDGGIYKTANPTSTLWSDLTNGMGITQFYRNAVSNLASFVVGGAQDNGSKRLNANGTASELTGGDGMNCELDPFAVSVYYTSSQYGSISRTTNNGTNFTNISNNIPGQPDGDWITPYLPHPTIPNMLVAGYDKVYMTQDKGASWTAISPAFSSTSLIKRLALSISDPSTIYAVINNGLRVTYDMGSTWNPIPMMIGGTVTDITVDPKDNKHLWITYGGYGNNKVAEYNNGTWTNHSAQLPNVPVNCILIDTANGTRYIGTDVAVFYKHDTMTNWAMYNNNLPAAQVMDLGINYTSGEIWAATYGRGMWHSPKFDAPVTPPPTGINMIPLAADVITVGPNPNDGAFTVRTGNAGLKGQSVQVRLIDLAGRTAFRQGAAFDASGNLNVVAEGLTRGTYIVEVSGGQGMLARTKMVVF